MLSLSEAPKHPHNVARETFIDVGGAIQPAPAPRYSVTENARPTPSPKVGEHGDAILADIGIEADRIAALRGSGAVR